MANGRPRCLARSHPAALRHMRLSAAQLGQFKRDGLLELPGFFSAAQVAAWKRQMDEHMVALQREHGAGGPPGIPLHGIEPPVASATWPTHPTDFPLFFMQPHPGDTDALRGLIEQVGGPDMREGRPQRGAAHERQRGGRPSRANSGPATTFLGSAGQIPGCLVLPEVSRRRGDNGNGRWTQKVRAGHVLKPTPIRAATTPVTCNELVAKKRTALISPIWVELLAESFQIPRSLVLPISKR